MIFIPDQDIERLMLEDIALGDLTTRSLDIGNIPGRIHFKRRQAGRVSGVRVARRVLQKLDICVDQAGLDGTDIDDSGVLLSAYGSAQALHQAWKVCQNILEWSCGVAQSMRTVLDAARAVNPQVQIACTRKSIPGTRLLATMAVLDGGGIVHRCGTAETVLLFANHRRFLPQPFEWSKQIDTLKHAAPEKKIVIEVDTVDEALLIMQTAQSCPDVIQMDKFTPEEVQLCVNQANQLNCKVLLAAAGGIQQHNAAQYAATGVPLLVTSAPYYSKPADVEVLLEPFEHA